eukprot:6474851-Amphidinium_carterae.1
MCNGRASHEHHMMGEFCNINNTTELRLQEHVRVPPWVVGAMSSVGCSMSYTIDTMIASNHVCCPTKCPFRAMLAVHPECIYVRTNVVAPSLPTWLYQLGTLCLDLNDHLRFRSALHILFVTVFVLMQKGVMATNLHIIAAMVGFPGDIAVDLFSSPATFFHLTISLTSC